VIVDCDSRLQVDFSYDEEWRGWIREWGSFICTERQGRDTLSTVAPVRKIEEDHREEWMRKGESDHSVLYNGMQMHVSIIMDAWYLLQRVLRFLNEQNSLHVVIIITAVWNCRKKSARICISVEKSQ
jgi:hypothetical protein